MPFRKWFRVKRPPFLTGQTLWFSLPRASLLLPFKPAVPGRLKAPGAYSLLCLYPYRQRLAQRGHSLNIRRMNQCPNAVGKRQAPHGCQNIKHMNVEAHLEHLSLISFNVTKSLGPHPHLCTYGRSKTDHV